MKNVLTRLSKSSYIQSLLEQTISEVFADDELLQKMTQDLSQELQSLDLNKGYLTADEEEQLKTTTGGFLGEITKKIINLTYQKFIAQHPENVNCVLLKTKTKHMLDIFLYNLKNSPTSCNTPEQQELYADLASLIEQKFESYALLLPQALPEFVISEVKMILLEDKKSVCYESVKLSDVSVSQSLIKSVILDAEVSQTLARFLSFSLQSQETQEASVLPIHTGFVRSAYENMYAAQTLYGEQSLEKLHKFLDLGYVEYEYRQIEKTTGIEKNMPLQFEDLHAMLLKNYFNPEALVENFLVSMPSAKM